jgi:hypothetical protein
MTTHVSARARVHPLGPALQDAHGVDHTVAGHAYRVGRGGPLEHRSSNLWRQFSTPPPTAGGGHRCGQWARGHT